MKRNVETKELKDILAQYTRKELDDLTYYYNIPGKSKMKKQELVEALTEKMKSKESIVESQIILGEAYMKMHEDDDYSESEKNFRKARMICSLGYGILSRDYEGINIFLAMDALQLLENGDEDISGELRRYAIVKGLILACVRLYGAYEIDFFIELFNKILPNEKPIDKAELSTQLMRCERMGEEAVEYNNLIVSDSLLMDESDLDELLQKQQGKDYYVPHLDELLEYEDEYYIEKNKEYIALEKFILKKVKDRDMAEGLIEDIAAGIRWQDASVKSLIYEFERRGIEFKNLEEVNSLMKVYRNLCNNTRMWANRGFTPNELRDSENLQPVKVEIGRNEPCPCGSGKKYKKCCLK